MMNQTRRDFLKSVSFVAASAAPFSLLASCSQNNKTVSCKKNENPNIIFLFADDQRFDTIRALGNKEIYTPNIDKIVKNGTTFTNAYIMGSQHGAVCAPSRAMVFTGKNLFSIPRSLYNPWEVKNPQEKDCPFITFPEVFRKAGYNTFGTGKFHGGTNKLLYKKAFTHGGNIFFGGMGNHFKVPLHDFDPAGDYSDEKIHYIEGVHSSKLFADASIDFLAKQNNEKPFMMYVAFMAPHDPRVMPKKFLDMYDTEKISLPKNFMPKHPFDNGELVIRDEKLAPWPRTPQEVKKHIAAYYAMITHLDEQIGRILQQLKATGREDNTIIVFAGDNGLALGRHGLMGKQNLYEDSIHVPLIFAGPGIPKNKKKDALCYIHDIYPTICDLANKQIPSSVESKSLAPIIKGKKKNSRDSLYFAYSQYQRAIRDDRYKLIEYVVKGKRTTQLFDLKNDPWELKNLAENKKYAKKLEQLRKELVKSKNQLGDNREIGKKFWSNF